MASIKVFEIFDSLQGEGKYQGTPATFVRLGNCNLKCTFCDTPAKEDVGDMMEFHEIAAKCINHDLVVITGGEPTIHENLNDFIAYLQDNDVCTHTVHVETNGYALERASKADYVVCSPKDFKQEFDDQYVDEFKLLVNEHDKKIEEKIERFMPKTSLQPLYNYNKKNNIATTLELCMKYDVQMSFRIHEYLGVE